MTRSVYDLRVFYTSRIGRVVRRLLQERIREFWPDAHGLRVMGCGYATPYLRSFLEGAERVFAVMPATLGAHCWPYKGDDERNLVCLAFDSELPVETSSIDRILLIHDLEFAGSLHASLQEIWRVLKPNGRLLLVVPNRGGFWSRADWSPFGQGTPFSAAQICNHLRDSQFIHERTEEALFMPPLKFSLVLKSAGLFERIGRRFLPFGAGVHIIEATKQQYARAGTGGGSVVAVRTKRFVPKPAPVRRIYEIGL